MKAMLEEKQARKAAKRAAQAQQESTSIFNTPVFYSPPKETVSQKQKRFEQDLVKNALSALQHAEENESDYKSESDEENSIFKMPVFKSKICSAQDPKQNNFFSSAASNIQNSVYEDFLSQQRKNVKLPGKLESPIPFESYCGQEDVSCTQGKMIGSDLMRIIDCDYSS